MDKEKARYLLRFVNDPDFDTLIRLFIELEQESIHRSLPNIAEEVTLRQIQGKLQQLERMKSIRERIIEAAK